MAKCKALTGSAVKGLIPFSVVSVAPRTITSFNISATNVAVVTPDVIAH